ncbi:MAG TPA: hypothetical protein VEG39_14810 [Clostridia bacterium]|nr:hypothetical protein [Clostridia bacterium]
MKKIITMVLVGLMVFSSSMAVFAEELAVQNEKVKKMGAAGLKEFTEEVHQINALRVEAHQLKIQLIEKQDKLFDLFAEAKEAENKEVFKAAKEERKQIKAVNDEMKALHEQAVTARKAFKEALKNNDKETAGAELEKFINSHETINDRQEDKVEILDKVIDILS